MEKLYIDGECFKDSYNRTVMLRGINLGGDCKYPYPYGATHFESDFSDHKDTSFINRPFPLDKADEHFKRLKKWGFNVLRLLSTWEAIEHEGQGIYDNEYLEYYKEICRIAEKYELYIIVDLHQDVWSRMTGGDGAPCWLFEKVGIDYKKISKSDAAVVMQHTYDFNNNEKYQKDNYPKNVWFHNNQYLGTAYMYTLFFGGKDFASDLIIDGKNVQDFMQEHYISCLIKVADKIKDFKNIIGFNTLNEPSPGWIGQPLKRKVLERHIMPGIKLNPIDALYISHGNSLEVFVYDFMFLKFKMSPIKKVIINKNKNSLWKDEERDVFKKQNVWHIENGKPIIVKNNFFQYVNGKKVDFEKDYLFPFIKKIADNLHKINPNWMIFGEKDPKELFFNTHFNIKMPDNFVNASHWYDLLLLHTRKSIMSKFNIDLMNFRLSIGKIAVENMYKRQLKRIKDASRKTNNGCPTIILEFGIPFNLDNDKFFNKMNKKKKNNKWKKHINILNSMYNAMDKLLLSCTLWNYTATNTNKWGDGWNQEDFSVYCNECDNDFSESTGGGRALEGFVRPYPKYIQGVLLKSEFKYQKHKYILEYIYNPEIKMPSIIFIPEIHFKPDYNIKINIKDAEITKKSIEQKLIITIKQKIKTKICIVIS